VNETATLWWDSGSESIRYVNQTLLPNEYKIETCRDIERWATAIRRLEVRGAPALGVAGACGVALAATLCGEKSMKEFTAAVTRDAWYLRATRPTAINLAWGIDRVLSRMSGETGISAARAAAVAEAEAVSREDTACCHAIGEHGAALLPDSCTVLTHCNAGALACSSWGTALGVIRSAVDRGKDVKVIACETRPLLQGARLTAWELARDGIDVTVITDSTAAHVMRTRKIDAVIVGADRITCDAVFNKIGTYTHAICARHHNIPFYVAAPLSTFDGKNQGRDVIIEERGRDEVTTMGDRVFVPDNAGVLNFGFDATPMELINAVITENGVYYPPIDFGALLSGRNDK
jgi:methylthioribose-1-phosphate isomerase